MSSGALVISADLSIPRNELTFRASRAGGPGGQHVNKASTRVELVWSVRHSRALDEPQRAILTEKLAARLDSDGELRVVASEHRSQSRNRDEAEDRLARLVRQALRPRKARRATRPTRSSIEKRLRSKKELSARKRDRRVRDFD